MTKRDTLTRIILHPVENKAAEVETKETIAAHVAIGATITEVTAYGKGAMNILHTVTDIPLDEGTYARYVWSNKRHRVMRQFKQGNEWFATLNEVNE